MRYLKMKCLLSFFLLILPYQSEASSLKIWDGAIWQDATLLSSQWTTSGSNIYYSSGNVSIGTTTTSATLDVKGTVSIFKDYASKTIGTVYQAETDGIVTAWGWKASTVSDLEGLVDTSNPPTTIRIRHSVSNAGFYCSISYPVRKGDYYKTLAVSGADTNPGMYFQALGK